MAYLFVKIKTYDVDYKARCHYAITQNLVDIQSMCYFLILLLRPHWIFVLKMSECCTTPKTEYKLYIGQEDITFCVGLSQLTNMYHSTIYSLLNYSIRF